MAAWKSLILILALLFAGVALSQPGEKAPLDTGGMTKNEPKAWGTMDGKSPFRLIRDDQ